MQKLTAFHPLRALVPLLLASCASYEFQEQDVLLRHDPETDQLELVLVYQGLIENGEDSAPAAVADGGGARHLIVSGWPWEFSFDEIEKEMADNEHPLAKRGLDITRGVSVVESGLFRNGGGALCLHQRVLVSDASGLLELVDAWVASVFTADQFDFAEAGKAWNEDSVKLWIERAKAKGSWASFEDGGLVLRLPMTKEGAARGLVAVLRVARDDAAEFDEFLGPLTSIELINDECVLRFLPDDSGWLRMHFNKQVDDGAKRVTVDASLVSDEPPNELVRKLVEASRD